MKNIISTIVAIIALSTITMAEKIGEVKTSGIFIKDKLEISVFDDGGVSCYVALPKKSLSFTDQTDASISCRQTGAISEEQKTNKEGVFSEKKSPFFKTMNVSRFYDAKRNVLVYVSYTEKMSGDNANNSISVVVIK